jgi:hypothetical protein
MGLQQHRRGSMTGVERTARVANSSSHRATTKPPRSTQCPRRCRVAATESASCARARLARARDTAVGCGHCGASYLF